MNHRMTIAIALLLTAACSPTPDADPVGTSEQGLCGQPTQRGTVDVTLSNGTCQRVGTQSAAQLFNSFAYAVVHVDTAPGTAAWVCGGTSPLAQQNAATKWAGCWNGGTVRNQQRVRGVMYNDQYLPAHADVTSAFVGRSVIVSYFGTLPAPPQCGYVVGNGVPPTHEHSCYELSDNGFGEYRQNSDPTDGTNCCNVSGQWPDGSGYGAPCTSHSLLTGDYVTAVYACTPS